MKNFWYIFLFIVYEQKIFAAQEAQNQRNLQYAKAQCITGLCMTSSGASLIMSTVFHGESREAKTVLFITGMVLVSSGLSLVGRSFENQAYDLHRNRVEFPDEV